MIRLFLLSLCLALALPAAADLDPALKDAGWDEITFDDKPSNPQPFYANEYSSDKYSKEYKVEKIKSKPSKTNPKLNELMNILEETEDKCIIWANYVHNIEMIKKKLREKYI